MASNDISAELLWRRQFEDRLRKFVHTRLLALPVGGSIVLALAWLDGHTGRLVLLAAILVIEIAVAIYYAVQGKSRNFTGDDVLPNVILLAAGAALAIYATGDVESPLLAGIALPAAFVGGVFGSSRFRWVILIPVVFLSIVFVGALTGILPRFPPLLAGMPIEFTILRVSVTFLVAMQVWRIIVWMLDDATKLTLEVEHSHDQLATEIEASQRTSGLLVSQLAHELRNPLAAIKGLHQLVRAAPEAADNAAHLHVIAEEIDRLETTIDAALDFGKPNSQQKVAFFELRAPFNSALRILQTKALRKNIEIEVFWPEPYTLRGDEQAWRQVFFNLLLNAIEALREGGHIWISANRKGTHLSIEIRDDGPGIAGEILASIWEPYVTGKQDGTGLGLSIVRHIIQNHGGTVELESVPEQGTLVSIKLPLTEVAV